MAVRSCPWGLRGGFGAEYRAGNGKRETVARFPSSPVANHALLGMQHDPPVNDDAGLWIVGATSLRPLRVFESGDETRQDFKTILHHAIDRANLGPSCVLARSVAQYAPARIHDQRDGRWCCPPPEHLRLILPRQP